MEEGEDLADADDDKDKEEGEDDYEVDNEFFVPHGYLSDEEEDKDEDDVFNPETAKEKLKLREQEFEAEHKKKTQQLKPRLWGMYWEGEELDTGAAAGQLVKILSGFAGIVVTDNNNCPIDTGFSRQVTSPEEMEGLVGTESAKIRGKGGRPGKEFPAKAIPDLVRLIHANPNNKLFLAREFLEFWCKKSGPSEEDGAEMAVTSTPSTSVWGHGQLISKRAMVNKILELAEWNKAGGGKGRLWFVRPEILTKLELTLPIPNEWTYILEQPNKQEAKFVEQEVKSRPVSPTASPAANLITKFARVLSQEEKEEQRVKQEKEAVAIKLRKEASKAEQLAKKDFDRRQESRKQKQVKRVQPKARGANKKKSKDNLGFEGLPAGIEVTKVDENIKSEVKASPIVVKKTPGSKTSAISVRKDLKPSSIAVRKDLVAVNPIAVKRAAPIAVKRAAGATASPIPIKKAMGSPANLIAFKKVPSVKTPGIKSRTSGPLVTNTIPFKRAPISGKPSVVQKVAEQVHVDCITIDD